MSQDVPVATTRVGWGFDAHVIDDNPPLLLGGVEVSGEMGLAGTSDADALAHAVTDAVLGACALGDIGEHFPSDDPSLEGADSMFMVRQTATMAVAAGFRIAHLDATVIAEQVRIAPHRAAIREKLAEALGVPVDHVSVKATSTDGMGYTGTAEGIAAVAVVTVVPTN